MNCQLCHTPNAASLKVTKKPEHNYFHCAECDLIFMEPTERLAPQFEKARYDQHENEDQAGHRAFLRPLVNEVENFVQAEKLNLSEVRLLDFGSGPSAALGRMFQEKNFNVTNYDLYYHPDQDALKRPYNIVTSTEVWEHLYSPREDIERMVRLTKKGGLLAVMTSGHKGGGVFADWYYRRDETHVAFYSEKTMNWIARKFELKILKAQSPYWLFKRI